MSAAVGDQDRTRNQILLRLNSPTYIIKISVHPFGDAHSSEWVIKYVNL